MYNLQVPETGTYSFGEFRQIVTFSDYFYILDCNAILGSVVG
jgi:hypothetical protein